MHSAWSLAALLALGGCGSGHGDTGGTTQPIPIAYAYVTSAGSRPGSPGAVYEYGVMNDGTVSPLVQASIDAGVNPSAVVVSQGHLYAVNVGDGTISQYTIESDNTLIPMSPAAVTNPGMHTFGTGTSAATVDPTGSFLYVANAADGNVSQFAIGGEGQLTALLPSTVAAGVAPVSIVAGHLGIYAVNSGAPGDTGNVAQYSENADGTLAPASAAPLAAGTNPTVIAFDGPFSTAYVLSNCDGAGCLGSIRQFSAGNDGALTDTGTVVTLGSHYRGAGMAIDQAGVHAYVVGNQMGVDTESGALWNFQIGGAGVLEAGDPAPLAIQGVALWPVIQNNLLYVLTTNSGVGAGTPATGGSFITYIPESSGALTLEATTPLAAPYPAAMAIRILLEP